MHNNIMKNQLFTLTKAIYLLLCETSYSIANQFIASIQFRTGIVYKEVKWGC